MDYFEQFGSLALAARLRRLGENLGQDIGVIYKQFDSGFEPRWFPFFQLLSTSPGLSVMEIAEKLSITHPSVIAVVDELKARKLVVSTPHEKDKRRILLSLSPEALTLHNMMNNIWRDLEQATDALIESCNSNILDLLKQLEVALEEKSLVKRFASVRKNNSNQQVTITGFKPALRGAFIRLNEEWIAKYFSLEAPDKKALENPEKYILAKGGFIFFARVAEEVVGTCALLKKSQGVFELSKMRVLEKYQGKKIGYKLLEACKEKAKSAGAKKLVLETNSTLKSAIKLYENAGFKHCASLERNGVGYSAERADVSMELIL